MDNKTPAKATDPCELERRIMDISIAKNEAEWWASHEITELREQLAAKDAAIEKLQAICDMWLWEIVNERKEHADARKQTQEALIATERSE